MVCPGDPQVPPHEDEEYVHLQDEELVQGMENF